MSPPRRRARRWPRKILAWAALLFAGTTLIRALVGDRGLVAVWQHRGEVGAVERELEVLREQNENLRRDIRSLRSDPRAIEPIAREDLGYARPGEVVILFPRQSSPGAGQR